MPKRISYFAINTKPLCFVEALLCSAALLLCVQTPSRAGQAFHPLTSLQARQLSHDLTRSSSQDFFRQGQERLESEIQILQRRRSTSTAPLLKVQDVPQVQRDSFPLPQ